MRLIDADALWMDIIHSMDYCDDILEIIENTPTVQPERKKGRWIQKSKPMEFSTVWWYECSECGDKPPRDKYGNPDYLSNYCPNCGADMRGDKDGN